MVTDFKNDWETNLAWTCAESLLLNVPLMPEKDAIATMLGVSV